jgi:4-hydroxybenzoate polyprenyltransferase
LTARSRVPQKSWIEGARVPHFAHFLLLPLAGYDPRLPLVETALSLGRGVLIAFSVLAFGYLLNSMSDRHMDASVEKNPLAGGEPSPSHRLALAALLTAALGLSLTGPWPVLAAAAICLGSGVVYSVGPRLKRIPVLGTLANTTNFAPLLWVGIAGSGAPSGMAKLTLAFTCLLLQNQLLHEAADRDEDRRGRVHTSVLVFGPRASAAAAALLGAGAALSAAGTGALSGLAFGIAPVFGAAFPLALARFGEDARAMARTRIVHRACCVVTGALIFVCLRLLG